MPRSQLLIQGRVVTPSDIIDSGAVLVVGDTILDVGPIDQVRERNARYADADVVQAPPDGYVLPGLIDTHNHGGGGIGFPEATDPESAMPAILEHRRHGTTTLIGSLVTAAPSTLLARVRTLVELCEAGELGGIHLEGPFLAAGRCGAQDVAAMLPPDRELVRDLLEAGEGHIVSMTLAPELPEMSGVLEDLIAGRVVPSIGHTEATDLITRDALHSMVETLRQASRARSARPTATHLFNGMPPLHHRDPGPLPELLSAAARGRAVVELIGDGVHLSPSLVRSVVEMVGADNVALVTDAMAATGMPDGSYVLGGNDVAVSGGVARRPDTGSLAGGTAHLVDVVRTTSAAGVPLADAVRMASLVPARILGLAQTGLLAPGAVADVLVVDADLRPARVFRRSCAVRGGELIG